VPTARRLSQTLGVVLPVCEDRRHLSLSSLVQLRSAALRAAAQAARAGAVALSKIRCLSKRRCCRALSRSCFGSCVQAGAGCPSRFAGGQRTNGGSSQGFGARFAGFRRSFVFAGLAGRRAQSKPMNSQAQRSPTFLPPPLRCAPSSKALAVPPQPTPNRSFKRTCLRPAA
jgi:hypothetical protein